TLAPRGRTDSAPRPTRRTDHARGRPAEGVLLLAGDRREPARPVARRCLIRHPEYTRARLAQTSERLRGRVYPETRDPDELLVAGPVDRISAEDATALAYRPAAPGERLGPLWATYWFRLRATVPKEWRGGRVDLLWATTAESTLWIDGRSVQGL